VAHLGELSKDQRAVTNGERLFQHFAQPIQLARTPSQGRSVTQELGRVVAHLLQSGERTQHRPASLNPFTGRVYPLQRLFDHRSV
jgi:hypothetical protein